MSLCDYPYSIPAISIDEYIGASLNTINNNFSDLKTEVCRLNDEVDTLTPDLTTLQTGLCSLSSNVSFAKAWVVFRGNGLFPFVNSKYKVLNVLRSPVFDEPGTYQIDFFSNTFSSNNYAIVGTCTQSESNNAYTWVQFISGTASNATISIRNTTGVSTTADYISVVVYGN